MITYNLELCIGSKANGNKPLVVKRHDTGVNIRASLLVCYHGEWLDKHERFILPDGAAAVLKITKPDNTYCVSYGIIEGNDILFPLPPQACTAVGIANAEVSVYDADGHRVSTATFSIDIPDECICDGAEQSKDYIDIVGQQVAKVVGSEKRADDAANRAEKARDEAEGFASHPPIIGPSGNWMEWDGKVYVDTGKTSQGAVGPQGPKGETGATGPQGEKGKDAVQVVASVEGGILSLYETAVHELTAIVKNDVLYINKEDKA